MPFSTTYFIPLYDADPATAQNRDSLASKLMPTKGDEPQLIAEENCVFILPGLANSSYDHQRLSELKHTPLDYTSISEALNERGCKTLTYPTSGAAKEVQAERAMNYIWYAIGAGYHPVVLVTEQKSFTGQTAIFTVSPGDDTEDAKGYELPMTQENAVVDYLANQFRKIDTCLGNNETWMNINRPRQFTAAYEKGQQAGRDRAEQYVPSYAATPDAPLPTAAELAELQQHFHAFSSYTESNAIDFDTAHTNDIMALKGTSKIIQAHLTSPDKPIPDDFNTSLNTAKAAAIRLKNAKDLPDHAVTLLDRLLACINRLAHRFTNNSNYHFFEETREKVDFANSIEFFKTLKT